MTKDREGKICGVRLNAIGHAEEVGTDIELSPRMKTILTVCISVIIINSVEEESSCFVERWWLRADMNTDKTLACTFTSQKIISRYDISNDLRGASR